MFLEFPAEIVERCPARHSKSESQILLREIRAHGRFFNSQILRQPRQILQQSDSSATKTWNSLKCSLQLEILRSLTNPVNLSRNRLWIIDDKWLNISGLYNLPGINPLNLKRFQIASTLDGFSLSFYLWTSESEVIAVIAMQWFRQNSNELHSTQHFSSNSWFCLFRSFETFFVISCQVGCVFPPNNCWRPKECLQITSFSFRMNHSPAVVSWQRMSLHRSAMRLRGLHCEIYSMRSTL